MVSPAETGANFQSQAIEPKSNRFKKLGLKVGVGVLSAATLFAARGALPAEASGNIKLIDGGGSTGEFCDNGDYVLQTDPVYAAQLLEQLASGELIIAIGPVPVAAAIKEGDKTATVQPKTITPGEIWANLAKPAPECPVVVDPTPTPEPTPTPVRHEAQELKTTKTSKTITRGKLAQDITIAYNKNTHPEVTDKIMPKESSGKGKVSAKGDLELCTTPNRRQIQSCVELLDGALYIHMLTSDPNFWNLAVDIKSYYVKTWPGEKAQLNSHLDQAFPPGVTFTLDDF